MQALLLNHRGSPWAVKWFLVHEVSPARPDRSQSNSPACLEIVPAKRVSNSVVRERSDGLALERSIMIATSLLSVATSALMLAKMFSDHRSRK